MAIPIRLPIGKSKQKMILYIGFIIGQGKLLPEFVTDDLLIARIKARRSVNNALPQDTVEVFEINFNEEEEQPLIAANWTPEGEVITLVPKP